MNQDMNEKKIDALRDRYYATFMRVVDAANEVFRRARPVSEGAESDISSEFSVGATEYSFVFAFSDDTQQWALHFREWRKAQPSRDFVITPETARKIPIVPLTHAMAELARFTSRFDAPDIAEQYVTKFAQAADELLKTAKG